MPFIEKKRRAKELTPHSNKRLKSTSKNVEGLSTHSLGQPIGQSVGLEDLPWQEVPFPETFEDAEGFFGLEEISDVEVVKDSSGIKYKVREVRKKGPKLVQKDHAGRTDAVTHGLQEEDPEWEGFGDPEDPVIQPAQSVAKDPEGKATWSMRKDDQGLRRKQGPGSGGSNAFEVLDTVQEDTDDGDGIGDTSPWGSLHLSQEILSSIARLKFSKPTAIQASSLPHILKGHDAICKAPTGSGKTLAFGIPIFEHYLKTRRRESASDSEIQDDLDRQHLALILSPTRELAHQLSSHLKDMCPGVNIATLTGGLSMQKQQRLIKNASIIIGTPGRLWEVMSSSTEIGNAMKSIKFLVLDEADRLLSSGHFQEVEEILNFLDRSQATSEGDRDEDDPQLEYKQQRQTLVFSATFDRNLQQKLAGKSKMIATASQENHQSMDYLLKKLNFREDKPKFINVNPISQMASGLKEGIVECAAAEKDLYLYTVLLQQSRKRTLVFTNSITSVRRLTSFLQNLSLPTYALHSQMPQKSRLHSLERFSSPFSSSILIATDVAARGLDIPSVELVVHYHVPRAADMYVHRSGRTARAEKSGSSVLLCAPEEVQGVRRLIAKVHARGTADGETKKPMIETLDLDRRIIARIKPRVVLSKKISDAALATEKLGHEENWLRCAAEDLGVDYDSEEFAAGEGSKKGRGQGRKKKEREARGMTKAEVGTLKAELKQMLAQRVNVGVSERYLTAGGVDVDDLLNGKEGEFLGMADGVMMGV